MSENITLLCVTILKISIICYTILFSETPGICTFNMSISKKFVTAFSSCDALVMRMMYVWISMVDGDEVFQLKISSNCRLEILQGWLKSMRSKYIKKKQKRWNQRYDMNKGGGFAELAFFLICDMRIYRTRHENTMDLCGIFMATVV